MTLEELEVDPTSSIFKGPSPSLPPAKVEEPVNLRNHTFWMVGEDGAPKLMSWTEDGRMVEHDEYGY